MERKIKELREQFDYGVVTLVTHAGSFHADDVLSAALLKNFINVMPGCAAPRIKRVAKVDPDEKGFVFDIGGGRYDHHQDNAERREKSLLGITLEDGLPTKYSAVSLIWRDFGMDFLQKAYLMYANDIIDKELLRPAFDNIDRFFESIDLTDNYGPKKFYNPLSYIIGSMTSTSRMDEQFSSAVSQMFLLLNSMLFKEVENVKLHAHARQLAKKADGLHHVVLRDDFIPAHLFEGTNIQFVISKSIREEGKWNMNAVPPYTINADMNALEGCSFIHAAKFMAVFDSDENAIKAAKELAVDVE